MELSYFLAQLIGLTIMVFSVLAFLHPIFIGAVIRDIRPHSFSTLLAGMFGVVIGLAIILSHNVWEMSWRVIITLMGWAALSKGITYVVFPEALLRVAVHSFEGKWQKLYLIVAFLLGGYLTYHGFRFGG